MQALARSTHRVILPLRLGLDPMEKLVVASFGDDPEFESFEPQTFDDPINGTGMRVLRYRKDGRVDVYHEPGVRLDPARFSIGTGLADVVETQFGRSRFEITSKGLDLDVVFEDAQGRTVELRVLEDAEGPRGFAMLAPVGADIAHPVQFFLAYMGCIDFVRRRGTLFEARVGDRRLKPASLPILRNGHRILFTRYADKPVVGVLNLDGAQPTVADVPAPGRTEVDGVDIETAADGRVVSMTTGPAEAPVILSFEPGLPDAVSLDHTETGRWNVSIAGTLLTGGTWRFEPQEGHVDVEWDVTRSWRPSGMPLGMAFVMAITPVFRTWPATYRWRGRLELGAEPSMTGRWERKPKRKA